MKATVESIGLKINELGNAERITKALLSELSREVLTVVLLDNGDDVKEGEQAKGTEDSRTVNELLAVLTPVNKSHAKLFFKHFMPFAHVTDEEGVFQSFGKKDKKQWDAKIEKVKEFIEDPHQNIWTWIDRNVEPPEVKAYNVAKVTKEIEKALKKANKADVIRAIMAGGLELADILEVLRPEDAEQE